jgi:ABC-type xylose transport system substrate-binding protein
MAGGIATALKGAGISGIPLTGQDAELAGVQRILAGTQSSTVYKAYKPEADTAATLAVDLLNGTSITSTTTTTLTSASGDKVPSSLLTPVSVTKANVKDTVIADKLYTVAQICTAEFAKYCTAAGIK